MCKKHTNERINVLLCTSSQLSRANHHVGSQILFSRSQAYVLIAPVGLFYYPACFSFYFLKRHFVPIILLRYYLPGFVITGGEDSVVTFWTNYEYASEQCLSYHCLITVVRVLCFSLSPVQAFQCLRPRLPEQSLALSATENLDDESVTESSMASSSACDRSGSDSCDDVPLRMHVISPSAEDGVTAEPNQTLPEVRASSVSGPPANHIAVLSSSLLKKGIAAIDIHPSLKYFTAILYARQR